MDLVGSYSPSTFTIKMYPQYRTLRLLMIAVIVIASTIPLSVDSLDLSSSKRRSSHDHNNNNDNQDMVRLSSSLCGADSFALGMEDGSIADNQIVASSSYNLQSVGPQTARLNREISGGAWCPSTQLNDDKSGTEWIQVDLLDYYVITAIATQGRFGNGMGVEFTEEYWIEYSRDNGSSWNKYTHRRTDHKLRGNHDTYTPNKNILDRPLVGVNLIRIVPYAKYQRTTCLRFELYGCRHDVTLPIAYSMPNGVEESALGDLRDLTYDGKLDQYGWLSGGLGQLVDGIKGDDNYKVNYGYEWIGWRAEEGKYLRMVFDFGAIVNFTSAKFYCHNLVEQDVQVFAGARVWFSFDGEVWSKRPIEFAYMPDKLAHARDVVIHLHQRAGRFARFDLQFANQWIMISDVNFVTSPVDDNFTITYDHLELPFDLLPFSTSSIDGDQQRALLPQTLFLIVFGVIALVLLPIALFLLRLHLRRKEKAGHIVVCMKDLATTPLYCEPKDFSSTSSTISNTVSDPEYAVPDVAMSNVLSSHANSTAAAVSAFRSSAAASNSNATTSNGFGGHLNSNLNMFGAGFTRIFMGGHLKTPNKQQSAVSNHTTTAPIPISVTLGGKNHASGYGPPININNNNYSNNISTPNVAYSTQKFPYSLGSDTMAVKCANGSSYTVNKPTSQSNSVFASLVNGRPYYASTELMTKSTKAAAAAATALGNNKNGHSNPALEHAAMMSNTIYNKRKLASGGGEDNLMTNGTTASSTMKLKYSSSNGMSCGGGGGDPIDEMKYIPEVSESDIEVIRTQWARSQFGEVLLGRFRDYPPTTARTKSTRADNDVSSEVPAEGDAGNGGGDKTAATGHDADQSLVILKTLENEKLRGEFVSEMKSKWFISAKSERVAKLIGYLFTPSRHMAMVLECGNCDLSHFLPNCDKKLIGIQALMHIGSEVAAGMKYLESLSFVHRDLSARNCIIYTRTLQVKISDLAAYVGDNAAEYCNGVPLRWIAPEALINGAHSTKSDVYSFGVTLWEILTYCLVRPHHELDDEAFLQKIFSAYESYMNDISNECSSSSIYYQATYGGSVTSGGDGSGGGTGNGVGHGEGEYGSHTTAGKPSHGATRLSYRLALQRPTTCPAEIYDLMLECWQLNEHTRPSFRDITQFLATRNHHNNRNNNSTNSNCNNNAPMDQVYA